MRTFDVSETSASEPFDDNIAIDAETAIEAVHIYARELANDEGLTHDDLTFVVDDPTGSRQNFVAKIRVTIEVQEVK